MGDGYFTVEYTGCTVSTFFFVWWHMWSQERTLSLEFHPLPPPPSPHTYLSFSWRLLPTQPNPLPLITFPAFPPCPVLTLLPPSLYTKMCSLPAAGERRKAWQRLGKSLTLHSIKNGWCSRRSSDG